LAPVVLALVLLHAAPAAAQIAAASADAAAARRADAHHLVGQATAVIRRARDAGADPFWFEARRSTHGGLGSDRAALVGLELTPLVTTAGSLESKRLATDPRWAAVLVDQFSAHGLAPGDTVLASFSGSFPGLNLAVMAACRVMSLRLVAVSSVTASTWGANEPGFTWPEMEVLVAGSGVLPAASSGVSIGGSRDTGADLDPQARVLAVEIQRASARALGAVALEAGSLDESIAQRLAHYRGLLAGRRPAAYVNVGGNHASLGGERAEFRHEEGWLPFPHGAADAHASVTSAFLAERVPVLSLLNIKALAARWRLSARPAPPRHD
jgi:poly-gamma-glutamate system protein